jgi:hypothetical protein
VHETVVEGLEADNERLRATKNTIECRFEVSEDTLKTIRGCLSLAESDIDALKAECEGLRKDAERYRFVIDCPIRTMVALGRKAHETDFDLSAECDRLMKRGGHSND